MIFLKLDTYTSETYDDFVMLGLALAYLSSIILGLG
jgi:hypothetical protein